MPNRKKRRERQRANRRIKRKEERLDAKTMGGHTDLTPYNAITGKDLMSAGRVTNPAQKLPGGFNTKKG